MPTPTQPPETTEPATTTTSTATPDQQDPLAEAYHVLGQLYDAVEQGDHEMSQLRQEADDTHRELLEQLAEAQRYGDDGAAQRIEVLIDQAQQAWIVAQDHLEGAQDTSSGTPTATDDAAAPAGEEDPGQATPGPGDAAIPPGPTQPTEPGAAPDGAAGSPSDEPPVDGAVDTGEPAASEESDPAGPGSEPELASPPRTEPSPQASSAAAMGDTEAEPGSSEPPARKPRESADEARPAGSKGRRARPKV